MKQRTVPKMPLAALKIASDQSPTIKANDEQHTGDTALHTAPALGAQPTEKQEGTKSLAQEIPLELIDKSPYQPRMIFEPSEIDALADSIEETGLQSPITVRKLANGRYELIGGERRLRAHKSRNKTTIPAFIKEDLSEVHAVLGALADNLVKKDLCDFERAKAFRNALELDISGEPKINQSMVAKAVNLSQATVSRCLSYFELPPEALQIIEKKPDIIGAASADKLAGLTKNGFAKIVVKALERIQTEGLSEKGAVQWAEQQTSRSAAVARISTPFNFNGHHVADIVDAGSHLVLKPRNGHTTSSLTETLRKLISAEITSD